MEAESLHGVGLDLNILSIRADSPEIGNQQMLGMLNHGPAAFRFQR